MLKQLRNRARTGLIGGFCLAAGLAISAVPASAALELPQTTTTPKPKTTAPKSTAPSTTAPQPASKCTKYIKGSSKWKSCVKRNSASLSDDDRYYSAYALAKSGEYAAALEILGSADNPDDPRILNVTGYSTRKLGDVDAAIPYYQKALSIDPNYHVAREYLGEGYLQKGDLPSALGQLDEIANRCGKSCEAYQDLQAEVDAYRKSNAL